MAQVSFHLGVPYLEGMWENGKSHVGYGAEERSLFRRNFPESAVFSFLDGFYLLHGILHDLSGPERETHFVRVFAQGTSVAFPQSQSALTS